MAGFYYFFEEGRKFNDGDRLNHQWLSQVKLSSLSDVHRIPAEASHHKCRGPGGKTGDLIYVKPTHGGEPQDYTYNPNHQEWLLRKEFWIGWDTSNPPTSEDLERKEMSGGYNLTDPQDNKWILPVVTSPEGRETLPCNYEFDENGEKLVQVTKPEYRRHWELAGEAAEYMFHLSSNVKLKEKWTEDWTILTAVEFVGINYRIGPHEVTALSRAGVAVIDSSFAVQVLHAATHWTAVLKSADYIKKKEKVLRSTMQQLQNPSHGAVA